MIHFNIFNKRKLISKTNETSFSMFNFLMQVDFITPNLLQCNAGIENKNVQDYTLIYELKA